MTAALDLREQITRRFPDAVPLPGRREAGVPSGIPLFDHALPNHGFPRGRPTVWSTPANGATSILMAATYQLLVDGQRAAWIDGGRLLGLGWPDGPLMLRPRTPLLGLRFAELLLESGGFSLVVLSGIAVERATLFRLGRAAHEGGGAAFALVTESGLPAALQLRSHYLPERLQILANPLGEPAQVATATVALDVTASGWQRHLTLTLPVDPHYARCTLHSGLADRRGSA